MEKPDIVPISDESQIVSVQSDQKEVNDSSNPDCDETEKSHPIIDESDKLPSQETSTSNNNSSLQNEQMSVIKPATAPLDSIPFDLMDDSSLSSTAQSLYPKSSRELEMRMSDNGSKNISRFWQTDVPLKWLEFDPISDGDSHLRNLIETYAKETKKALLSQQEVEDKLKLSKKEQETVWKTVTRVVEKYGKCADGNNVKATHTFDVKEFDKAALENLGSSLTDLRNSAVTNVHIHSARIARLELDAHVYSLCMSPHSPLIKNALKQFWGYTRFGESDVVHVSNFLLFNHTSICVI